MRYSDFRRTRITCNSRDDGGEKTLVSRRIRARTRFFFRSIVISMILTNHRLLISELVLYIC